MFARGSPVFRRSTTLDGFDFGFAAGVPRPQIMSSPAWPYRATRERRFSVRPGSARTHLRSHSAKPSTARAKGGLPTAADLVMSARDGQRQGWLESALPRTVA